MTDADIHIPVQSVDEARTLLGPLDSNARLIRELHGVSVLARDGSLRLLGDAEHVSLVQQILEESLSVIRSGRRLSTQDVAARLRATLGAEPGVDGSPEPERAHRPVVTMSVRARTPGQQRYLECLEAHDVVFAIGPAGTGKTYLAVAKAIEAMKRGMVRRIVLVRPAVEAGEKLGFLPGDLQEKVNPYLRPLYDALYDMLDVDRAERLLERGTIEVAPIAFMRGRTLNDAFVVLDEAQNTTVEQMKMFLTRLGYGSKAVVTGDITQIDLPPGRTSGLVDALQVVSGIDGIAIVRFDDRDVVRHRLVQAIVKAYEAATAAARG